MSVPDYSQFVVEFLRPRLRRFEGDVERTRTHSFEQLNACVGELHARDPRVGLLEKTGGARVRERAADIIAYDLGNGSCQLFDVIGDAEGEDGQPSPGWSAVEESRQGIRPISQWRRPYAPEFEPKPTPARTAVVVTAEAFEEAIATLRNAWAADVLKLQQRIDELERRKPAAAPKLTLSGKRIALRDNRGRYGRADWGDDSLRFDRGVAGDGETFTIEEVS
jgi:hypothetical protein